MSEYDLPFIYIAALPRTGSTLLSEALTQLPYCFIFHEPHLGKNYFALQETDLTKLQKCGIDVERFARYRLLVAFFQRRIRFLGLPQDYMVREFKNKLMPSFRYCMQQIGVKEIKQMGWQNYVRHFPNMKVVMTGRDPRDLYISLYYKWQRGTMVWRGVFTPETVAAQLNHQFQMQLSIKETADTFCLRYEDLCTRAGVLEQVKKFTRSPIPDIGEIGGFIAHHPRRMIEHDIHGGQITDRQVQRWQQEKDNHLLANAYKLFDLMPAFCEFWDYAE